MRLLRSGVRALLTPDFQLPFFFFFLIPSTKHNLRHNYKLALEIRFKQQQIFYVLDSNQVHKSKPFFFVFKICSSENFFISSMSQDKNWALATTITTTITTTNNNNKNRITKIKYQADNKKNVLAQHKLRMNSSPKGGFWGQK